MKETHLTLKRNQTQSHTRIWMEMSWVRVRVILTTFKIKINAPNPVLVTISLSKENTLAKKSCSSYNGPSDKDGVIQRAGMLSDSIKGYKTYRLSNKCLSYDIYMYVCLPIWILSYK